MSLRTTLLAVAASALVLTGCAAAPGASSSAPNPSPSESAPTSTATGTFTYVIASDPISLNPINTGDRWGLTTANIVSRRWPTSRRTAPSSTSSQRASSRPRTACR